MARSTGEFHLLTVYRKGFWRKGYVARKGERYYAVVYEGLDPLAGRERRRWHPAGTCEAEARGLAARLAEARASDAPASAAF